jgi:DNA-binding transcriptional MerR regulator
MSTNQSYSTPRLLIGELAVLADTTTRTIRHYHAIGLLAEPERDESGYRRYGAEDLIRLIRIRRLRDVDMPLHQIADHLSRDSSDLPTALRSLAADISRQIESLEQLRARVLGLLASSALDAPAETWRAALQRHGHLEASTPLPTGERASVELLDALHPDGIQGVITQTSALMADPLFVERLEPLLHRFRTLPEDADEQAIELLAADYVALLPAPQQGPPAVDLDAMDKLIGDRLSPAQLRCLHIVRRLFEVRDQ